MRFDPSTDWFYKKPADTFPISYVFTNDIVSGDSLASCLASVTDEDDVDVTSSMLSSKSVAATKVTFTISKGVADTTYDIKLVGYTSNSRAYTHNITCEVFGSININANLGDFSANSYVTVQQANDYIRDKYGHTSAWDTLSVDAKKRVLIESTRSINRYNYIGDKYYDSQSMEFPRKDHDVVTGNCGTPLTINSFTHSNLYSTTYNKYPANYWKYGSCHITAATALNDVRMINTSNSSTGKVTMKTNFSATPSENSTFIIFTPVHDNIKHAQCEQAVFILSNQNSNTMFDYKELGAQRVRIGDTEMQFFRDMSKIPLSSTSKKLLSRFFRKEIRVARA